MGQFNLTWHDADESILLWVFPNHYSIAELRHASDKAKAMLEGTTADDVNIIIDMRGSVIDSRTGSVDELRKAYAFLPEIVQKLIFVSPSGFTQVILSMMMTMDDRARSTSYQVESVPEALDIIKSQQ